MKPLQQELSQIAKHAHGIKAKLAQELYSIARFDALEQTKNNYSE